LFMIYFRLIPALFLAVVGIVLLSFGSDLRAQQPTFTITSESPQNGAEQVSAKSIVLRERRLTLLTYDTLPQRGYIIIRRTAPTTATIFLNIGVQYLESGRPLPDTQANVTLLPTLYTDLARRTQAVPMGLQRRSVAISTFHGDLEPTLFLNTARGTFNLGLVNTTQTQGQKIQFLPETAEAIIEFTARWSDQSFPNNSGLQGERVVVVRLLGGEGYTLAPLPQTNTTLITLDDPANVPPILLSTGRRFCQDIPRLIGPTMASSRVEIGPTLLDSTGLPNSFFYDDNYDPLSYSLTNSNPNILTARIEAVDARFAGRPSLYLDLNQMLRSTTVSLSVFARDGRGGVAETSCPSLAITTSVKDQQTQKISLSTYPNPTSSEARFSYTLTEPTAVRIEVFSTLGERLITLDEGTKASGEHSLMIDASRLVTGVYPVRLTAGRTTQAVMMRILR
jgi:Secretion system C-terminal sorting domain